MFEKKNLLGVGITNAGEQEVLEYILRGLGKSEDPYYIVTPNPEILVYATKHASFRMILNNARLGLADGIGVLLGGKVLGKHFKGRTTGVDLMERLCEEVSKRPITVGFLGGGTKVAERTAECLSSKYPGLQVIFAALEWSNKSLKSPKSPKLPTIDLLFVAFGFPKQEEWMASHVGKVPVRVMIAVGGAFDYISGSVPRAPLLIRKMGLEWLFRLIVQPWRWKRQLALVEFVWLVVKEKLHSQKK